MQHTIILISLVEHTQYVGVWVVHLFLSGPKGGNNEVLYSRAHYIYYCPPVRFCYTALRKKSSLMNLL